MFAQQNKLRELFPKYGWELVETQIPNYDWIAEIWLIKSIWTPTDCFAFISFEVDPMGEDRNNKMKGVWAINLSMEQPYYWQDDETHSISNSENFQFGIRTHFEESIPEIFDSLNNLRLEFINLK